jgi:hypothetical protein
MVYILRKSVNYDIGLLTNLTFKSLKSIFTDRPKVLRVEDYFPTIFLIFGNIIWSSYFSGFFNPGRMLGLCPPLPTPRWRLRCDWRIDEVG